MQDFIYFSRNNLKSWGKKTFLENDTDPNAKSHSE